MLYRLEAKPFSDKQISLVQNFAAQAVIAMENARLLNELRESLQQQTATADVLKVISGSPGELEPCSDHAGKGERMCEASYGNLWLREGKGYRADDHGGCHRFGLRSGAAERSTVPGLTVPWFAPPRPASRSKLPTSARTRLPSRRPVAVRGVEVAGIRTLLLSRCSRKIEQVGLIVIYRKEVRAFSDKQIDVIELRRPSRHRH